MTWRTPDLDKPSWNFALEVAKGKVPGHALVNVQGRAPAGLQTTATDIWDRADATPTQQTLTSPTVARVHGIVSGSANDDGDPVGTGARTVRVHGLTSWTTAETSEDITLNGTGSVNTTNSYVHINKMRVLTVGSGGTNAGAITATAATDTTVSAHMLAGQGKTQMAIYAIPSTKVAYLMGWRAGIKSATTTIIVNVVLKINPNPQTQLVGYYVEDTMSLTSLGTCNDAVVYPGYLRVAGPAIIKLQATSDANDVDCSGGFDLILVDN